MEEIVSYNPPLVLAVLAMTTVQLFKFFFAWAWFGRPDFTRLVGTGGLPSAHSASVTALSATVGFEAGWNSTLFGAVCFFSLVIMYDATGIRRAAGRQAQILNRMLDELKDFHKLEPVRLKELLGHTPLEVLLGAAYGILLAVVFHR
ncbi:MAG: divergent PAP2 family protein [Gemmatimonadota bacterium]